MNHLEIVQEVARLSGVGDPRSIATTQGATGSTAKVVSLVQAGWTEIQNAYRAWRFLVVDFPETLVLEEGLNRFTASSLNLPNWSEWIRGDTLGQVPVTVWPAANEAEGLAEARGSEQQLAFVDYPAFRRLYQTGSSVSQAQSGQPRVASIDNQDRLVVWPTPDRNYGIAGTYRRLPQVFSADTDEPIVSAEHHDTIVWKGTLLVNEAEEAELGVLRSTERGLNTRMAALRRRYLDPTRLSYEPLGSGRLAYRRPFVPPNPSFAG